ncbi:death ligand signal enhancer isoform X1 [Hemiscyllium ocellatum]|uniref:death ligand signal enhancer isoform X1 n=1 Tax=Hemiscyllium ocellatum TaxID=170820 RepID=UPI002965F3E5|nr:death ligand signal enhancer isoform X1 [Hemiscyllium ocellatum]
MWRIKAAAWRVLHRWSVTGPSPSLRLPPTHSAEDDVINSSLVSTHPHFKSSSTDSRNGEEREKREKEQNAQFCSKQLPRFSGLDAVGWGAAAVVFLQFARHLHHQFCHRNGPQESDAALPFSVRSIVTSTLEPARIKFKQCILPQCVTPHSINNSRVENSVSIRSTPPANVKAACSRTKQQKRNESIEQDEPLFIKDIRDSECSGSSCENGQQGDLQREHPNPEEILNKATSNLQGAAKSSISSILNIIGLKNMKAKDYDMAFSYFMVAANQGYSKAQYNVGVCYELGKGTVKDIKKAAVYYSYAAAQGHNMAQFRWAMYLLHIKPDKEAKDTQEAVEQLEKAAKSGLKEAQAYLGVFFTKEPHKDLHQAARYLTMASESGDPESHYNLGICYEKGWAVMTDLRRAAELYQKAAALEHADAQCALGVLYQQGLGGLPMSFSKAIELYRRAARSGSVEAVHNLQCLMEDLQIKGSSSFANEHTLLRSVMSSPCLPPLASPRSPIPQEHQNEDWGDHQLQAGMASGLPHSWSTGGLHVSPLSNKSLVGRDGLLRSVSTTCLNHRLEPLADQFTSHGGVAGVG